MRWQFRGNRAIRNETRWDEVRIVSTDRSSSLAYQLMCFRFFSVSICRNELWVKAKRHRLAYWKICNFCSIFSDFITFMSSRIYHLGNSLFCYWHWTDESMNISSIYFTIITQLTLGPFLWGVACVDGHWGSTLWRVGSIFMRRWAACLSLDQDNGQCWSGQWVSWETLGSYTIWQ